MGRGAWHPVAVPKAQRSQPDGSPHPTRVPRGADGPVEHTFTAPLWQWDARRQDTWTFVTLPPDVTTLVEDAADARGPRAGFGSVRVEVRIGATTWRTSVFPDSGSGCFALPIKRAVRQANGLRTGDDVSVHLRVI